MPTDRDFIVYVDDETFQITMDDDGIKVTVNAIDVPATLVAGDNVTINQSNGVVTISFDDTGFVTLDGVETLTNKTISGAFGVSIEPTPNTVDQALAILQSSPTTGTTQGELHFNEINVTSAVKVLPGSPSTQLPFGDNLAAGLKITMTEGANAGGFQVPLLVRLNKTVVTDIWGGGSGASDHIVMALQGYSSAADTAVAGAGAGFYGLSIGLYFDAGAVHSHIVAANPEIGLAAGVTVANRVCVRIQSNNVQRGSVVDAAISVTAFSGSTGTPNNNGWGSFVTFSEDWGDAQSIISTGHVFTASQSMTVANFANLSNMTVTGSILKFPHVNLTGAAVLTLNPNSVAIGSTPAAGTGTALQVVGVDSTIAGIEVDTFGSGATVVPSFRGVRSRGTAASRTAVQAGDALVTFAGDGYNGTTILGVLAGMSAFAEENFTVSAAGTNLTFATTPTGSLAAVTRARISAAGLLTLTQNSVAVGSIPAPPAGTILQIVGADSANLPTIDVEGFGSGGTEVPTFRGTRSRGTAASRTTVATDDALAVFGGGGYDGSAFSTGVHAGITAFASQTWTGSAHGAYLTFASTADGSTTATTRGAVEKDGGLTWPRAVTGGSKGAGTGNFTGLYQANVQVATLSGAEALTNKTYNGNTWTAGTGTLTIAAGKTATHNASTTFAGTDGKTLTVSNSGTLSGGDAFVLSIAAAKTLTVSNTLTFTGTDSSSVAFGAGGTVAYVANKLSVFAATSSSELAGVISDETGSGGALVFASSPTIATPTLSTSFTSPLHIGGTTASSTLTLESTSGTGTSDAIILLTGSQVERGRINTSGQWQIGPNFAPTTGTKLLINANTVAPQSATSEAGTLLHLTNADASTTRITIDSFGSAATDHPSITYRTSRGTQNSPTATQNGDFLGSNFGKGRGNAGSYLSGAGAGFIFVATQAYTTTGGARIDLYATEDSQSSVTKVVTLDKPTTATQTALMLWDVDNATLERVTVGAADSGGAGFKVLRIPN